MKQGRMRAPRRPPLAQGLTNNTLPGEEGASAEQAARLRACARGGGKAAAMLFELARRRLREDVSVVLVKARRDGASRAAGGGRGSQHSPNPPPTRTHGQPRHKGLGADLTKCALPPCPRRSACTTASGCFRRRWVRPPAAPARRPARLGCGLRRLRRDRPFCPFAGKRLSKHPYPGRGPQGLGRVGAFLAARGAVLFASHFPPMPRTNQCPRRGQPPDLRRRLRGGPRGPCNAPQGPQDDKAKDVVRDGETLGEAFRKCAPETPRFRPDFALPDRAASDPRLSPRPRGCQVRAAAEGPEQGAPGRRAQEDRLCRRQHAAVRAGGLHRRAPAGGARAPARLATPARGVGWCLISRAAFRYRPHGAGGAAEPFGPGAPRRGAGGVPGAVRGAGEGGGARPDAGGGGGGAREVTTTAGDVHVVHGWGLRLLSVRRGWRSGPSAA